MSMQTIVMLAEGLAFLRGKQPTEFNEGLPASLRGLLQAGYAVTLLLTGGSKPSVSDVERLLAAEGLKKVKVATSFSGAPDLILGANCRMVTPGDIAAGRPLY